jgi:hypothetical protein
MVFAAGALGALSLGHAVSLAGRQARDRGSDYLDFGCYHLFLAQTHLPDRPSLNSKTNIQLRIHSNLLISR